MADKRIFKFTDSDGQVQKDIELFNTSEMQEYYTKLVKMQDNFYNLHGIQIEQPWRNDELVLTDKLLQVDSTYNGEMVLGSTMYDDILAYRTALRNYAYKTSDPRPVRPSWYKG